MNLIKVKYVSVVLSLLLFSSCYIKKEATITVKYLQSTYEFEVPGSGISYTPLYMPNVVIPDQTVTTPSQTIPNFNFKEQLKTIGVDTTSQTKMENAIIELSIDSVAMEVADVDKNKAAANFSYFKKIDLTLNSSKLASYQTLTPSTAGKLIIFTPGDNMKSLLLSNQDKIISSKLVTNGANIPSASFKVKMAFRMKLKILVSTSDF